MTPEQIKSNLVSIINTLNTIEIKGRENMNRMLGSIVLLEKVIQDVDNIGTPEIKLEEIPNA